MKKLSIISLLITLVFRLIMAIYFDVAASKLGIFNQDDACFNTTFFRSAFAYTIWIFLSTVFFLVISYLIKDELKDLIKIVQIPLITIDIIFLIPIFIDYENSYLCGSLANLGFIYITVYSLLFIFSFLVSYRKLYKTIFGKRNDEAKDLLNSLEDYKYIAYIFLTIYLITTVAWIISFGAIYGSRNLIDTSCSGSYLFRIWILNICSDVIIFIILLIVALKEMNEIFIESVFFCVILKTINIAGTYSTFRDFSACESLYDLSVGYLIFNGIFIIINVIFFIGGICIEIKEKIK